MDVPKSFLSDLLRRHEGLRLKPYRDTVGKLTIGVGRNLDDVGISKEEALWMLQDDIARAEMDARKVFRRLWHPEIFSTARHAVIVSMVFNLGLTRFRKFKKMIAAVQAQDWHRAADEMLNSKWARQVGRRARELAKMMREG